ncbi:hypothetical protein [Streptomyces sp. NPDC056491]|uniref:hypothetical protein n=1 Tax=Streptomyces sp. NPDC056491 TaxID=3345837 RepID=UPI0036C3286D
MRDQNRPGAFVRKHFKARVRALKVRTPDGPVEVRRYGFDDRGNLDAIMAPSAASCVPA